MLDTLLNPGTMTQSQWMIVGILFLLLLGIVFFLHRTYLVIRESSRKKYKPNIGLSRIQDVEKQNSESQEP